MYDAEGERREERAEYCAEHHPDFEGDTCPECESEEARFNEGPDPDDANDRAREREYDDAE
jgi:hypothetical protein